MIRTMLAATAVAVLTTASLTTASPAAAVTPRPARTNLTLSYMADAGYAAAVVLRCNPVGGAHPKGRKACAVLKKVDGRPDRLRTAPGVMCTMEYAPITAEITGTWKGRTVDWSRKFGNSCALAHTTGVLFAF